MCQQRIICGPSRKLVTKLLLLLRDAVGRQLRQTAKKRLSVRMKTIDCVYAVHILPGRWGSNSGKATMTCASWLAAKAFGVSFVCIQVQMTKLCVWRVRETWTPLEGGWCLFSLGFHTVIYNLWRRWEGTEPLCRLNPYLSLHWGTELKRHSSNRQLLDVSKNCLYFCDPFSRLACKKKSSLSW